jgi:gliding motility-associated-like protein
MSRLPIYNVYTGARQNSRQWLSLFRITAMLFFYGNASAEGTRELEPKGVCKILLSKNSVEYRIPFALVNCKEDFRLNIRIRDYTTEKIYLGFGNVFNYRWESVIYKDVKFQVKGPDNKPVKGFILQSLPQAGKAGFINSRYEVDAGPDINGTIPQGYDPLVITPEMNGDYIIEFEIPDAIPNDSIQNEMRLFKYFDATVARGNNIIPGRLWSKAWQLATRAVEAITKASYALFYIYTNDSIVTRFDCNGLAGGVWAIYSNQWGSSASGEWSDRRQSQRGNTSVKPEYKIFLNDPDLAEFPSGHIGEMLDFKQVSNECDTVIIFAANVTKDGNIDFLVDVAPLNPNFAGPEDVQLRYNVKAGYNVLLPAWDGKDGNGNPIPSGTKVSAYISFLNGLSNVPLYDVEDNPHGFKVDIQRPMPASGVSKLKLYWDDTKLPSKYFPTNNATTGCLYDGNEPVSGCHAWTYAQNLGDTNTINSWWYLTTDQVLNLTITLNMKPLSGHITGTADACRGQSIRFSTTPITYAQTYTWRFSGNGFSVDFTANSPDTTFVYNQNESINAGKYLVSVFGRNLLCGAGKTVTKSVSIHNRPEAAFANGNTCQGAGITFTDQSIAADAILNDFTWTVKSVTGDVRTIHGNPAIIVFDTTANYTVRLLASDLLGCSDTVSRTITIKAKPDCAFEIIENPGLDKGELNFDNQTFGASAYLWNFGNNITSTLTEPFIKYDLEGNYAIMLVASNTEGCKDTAIRQYYYMPGLWFPNAFSPDNNDKNEIFRPVTQRNTLEPYQLLVFDRWGQLIFKTTDPKEGWDGTYKGDPCQSGSYSYLVQYREGKIDGSEILTKRGMVSLIR